MNYKPVSEKCTSPECTRLRRPGQRYCYACHREHARRYRERNKEKIAALVASARAAGIVVTEWERG